VRYKKELFLYLNIFFFNVIKNITDVTNTNDFNNIFEYLVNDPSIVFSLFVEHVDI